MSEWHAALQAAKEREATSQIAVLPTGKIVGEMVLSINRLRTSVAHMTVLNIKIAKQRFASTVGMIVMFKSVTSTNIDMTKDIFFVVSLKAPTGVGT